jgi:glycosyltransferase involved in cell wall biosynthesis
MRLVAVQTGLSPLSVLGGNITHREFLTRLADRGVEVHVLAEEGEPIIEHKNLVPHYWRRRLRKKIPYVGNIDVAMDLRNLLAELGSVDWIRFSSPYHVGLGTLLSANGHRIWGTYLHCEDHLFWRWVDRWLPKHCDLITCLSEDTRQDLVTRCPEADHANTVVLPMGIDLERCDNVARSRQDVRRSLGLSDDDIVTLFIGVLIPRKGIKDLVMAWKTVPHNPRHKLVLLAKPVEALETALVAELVKEDPRVIHIEKVLYEHVPEYIRASDIFFFPTHLEGFGIVVGEAMGCGLPVITTRAKGVREVFVENETALVADIGSPPQLAEHLQRLQNDAELRMRLGKAGRRRIESHFSWDRIIDSLMGSLETLQ